VSPPTDVPKPGYYHTHLTVPSNKEISPMSGIVTRSESRIDVRTYQDKTATELRQLDTQKS
jgi:hypothetical protein